MKNQKPTKKMRSKKMRFDLIFQLPQQNPHCPRKVLSSEGIVSRLGRFAQRLRTLWPASTAGSVGPTYSAATEGCHLAAAHPRCLASKGAPQRSLLFRSSACSQCVHNDLREHGIRTSRKRVARLMKQDGLVGRSRARRRVTTTNSRPAWPLAHNLLERRFAPTEAEICSN